MFFACVFFRDFQFLFKIMSRCISSVIPVQERKQKEQENAMRADALLRGNPLVQPSGSLSSNVKRRWDDDVVFRNMARDEPAEKKRFINDTIRSDFHKRFLKRYVQ
jgi:protein CWC15